MPLFSLYTTSMIKNDDAQSNDRIQKNGRILANNLLHAKKEARLADLAESIQYLLSWAADSHNQANYPVGVATVKTALEILFEVLEPEEVVL